MPWTPSRLEQRVGRVDRIGQPLPVRAACLVGRGGPEEQVLVRVAGRAHGPPRRSETHAGAAARRPRATRGARSTSTTRCHGRRPPSAWPHGHRGGCRGPRRRHRSAGLARAQRRAPCRTSGRHRGCAAITTSPGCGSAGDPRLVPCPTASSWSSSCRPWRRRTRHGRDRRCPAHDARARGGTRAHPRIAAGARGATRSARGPCGRGTPHRR